MQVNNVRVDNVWGDGLELAPLRAAGDISSQILNPTENVTVNGLRVNGAGRQGVSLVSVTGATLTNVSLRHVALNSFDVEADQWDEGAKNITINGCQTGDVGGFFANGGASAEGSWRTGNITVENCTMTSVAGGDPILIQGPSSVPRPRGPFTFANDTLQCGASVYVACIQANEADLTVTNSNVIWPAGEIREPVFHLLNNTSLNLSGDSISGYTINGWKDPTSTVAIVGGQWVPYTGYVIAQDRPGGASTSGTTVVGGTAPTSTTTSSTTTSTTTSSTTTVPAGLTSLHNHHKQKGTGLSSGGPTTATVLTSGGNNPLTSPLVRSVLALDLGAGAVAYGLLELRRRRRVHVVPAAQSVQDLLGRPRRSGSA